ncbi:helix-turn-helix domain-containing protein [Streptomyces sp. LHD-70]|uniref:TetR/AcrR family transcriptional regulator n=1 Tax=Streptomyces sp. LHD-70 TaxID=3072140 RepID=UPI00280EB6FC|nr:helix-turn-helix domain-containing protein [Streptomyces sp. LHD-70]MDQ8702214.1 helix-turn-helix domain-containing protein [Streptomyces sp. LHD-70]
MGADMGTGMATERRAAILEAAAGVIARRGVRGLRVADIAAEAGVSTALVYYHFKGRADILRRTLEFISDRAQRYTAHHARTEGAAVRVQAANPPRSPRRELERALLLELQDRAEVRENSTAWGELRASAVFDPELRTALSDARLRWIDALADTLGRIHRNAPPTALTAAAERLTATLEGLSTRWLGGILPLPHARELLREAIAVELSQLRRTTLGRTTLGRTTL